MVENNFYNSLWKLLLHGKAVCDSKKYNHTFDQYVENIHPNIYMALIRNQYTENVL